MIPPKLRDAWAYIRAHPYADLTAILVFLMLSGGGFRWWGRPTVLLTVDGVSRKLHPTGKTVRDALAQAHVTLGVDDFVTPSPDTPLDRNTSVHVTRVVQRVEVVVNTHSPKMTQRIQLKANLRLVLVERGFVQVDSQTVKAIYYDGVKTSEKVLKRKIRRRPVFTLTLFNAKTGQPVKTYDLAKAKKLYMRATGYYVGEKYVPSDTTFLGFKLRRGLVAVDPKVIPLRTRLYVKGYGYAYAADTGSAIKGNRIDLAVKGKKEEAAFNRQEMIVYILEKARSW